MIIAKNITKIYGKSEVLKGVTLELNKGDINVLIGASGSGKSTLCRNLALLDLPTSGLIDIDGIKYTFPTKKIINHPYPKVNFVYQQLFLWPHLTNEKNILLPLKELTKEKKEKLDFFIEFLDLKEVLQNFPNESSLGQRQRVAIVRALMLNPEFLFFDEITSSLDIVQTNKIIQLIRYLKKETVGVMIITHNLQLAYEIADKVFFMNNGKVTEQGNSIILTKPNTETLKNFLNGVG